jgi:hypothetical protein
MIEFGQQLLQRAALAEQAAVLGCRIRAGFQPA